MLTILRLRTYAKAKAVLDRVEDEQQMTGLPEWTVDLYGEIEAELLRRRRRRAEVEEEDDDG